MIYRMTRSLVRWLVRLVAIVEVVGTENVPSQGGYILASNHLGRLDAALVYSLLDRDDIILMVAEKYRKYRFFRWLVKEFNAIWLDRYNADWGALRETMSRLRNGWVLAAAPEGTRSPTEALLPGKPGLAYMAAKTGLQVVPVAIYGTEDRVVFSRLKRLTRLHVHVQAGMPFQLPPLDGASGSQREEALRRYTDEIMCQIAAMLPVQYRGVYSDHPRLKELLSSAA
jgi:1-acyl-sn-glycerol-3-phosphate acyltransferase